MDTPASGTNEVRLISIVFAPTRSVQEYGATKKPVNQNLKKGGLAQLSLLTITAFLLNVRALAWNISRTLSKSQFEGVNS